MLLSHVIVAIIKGVYNRQVTFYGLLLNVSNMYEVSANEVSHICCVIESVINHLNSCFVSMSNCAEIATGWDKAREHFSPIDIHVSQSRRDALQHFTFSITAFGKSIGSAIIKLVQNMPSAALQGIASSYQPSFIS